MNHGGEFYKFKKIFVLLFLAYVFIVLLVPFEEQLMAGALEG